MITNFFQRADLMRKKPAQRRAEATVETILEATTQILDRDGGEKLSTNDIAERSGFSVGTLYQYFRNKDAILQALAERELRVALEKFDDLIANEKKLTREGAVRAVVQVLIEPFAKRPRARRAALLILVKRADLGMARDFVMRTAGKLFERMRYHAAFDGMPDKMRQTVLVAAVMGAIRGTLIGEPEVIASKAFEDELVVLILAYLAAPSASEAVGKVRSGEAPSISGPPHAIAQG